MKRSFTLVELMLVVVIIGILASIAVPNIVGKADKARRAAAKADVESNLPSAIDMYEMDVGEYPQSLADLITNPGVENWDGPYLKKVPKDPWKREYHYKVPGDHGLGYDVACMGKDGTLGTEDDIIGWE